MCEGSFLPSSFGPHQNHTEFESSLRSYPINPSRFSKGGMLPHDPPSRNHRHFTVRLPCWPHSDLNVLSQGSEELHEALDREDAGAVSHQSGNVRLLDPKNLAGFSLRNAALLDEAVNLQREFGLQ